MSQPEEPEGKNKKGRPIVRRVGILLIVLMAVIACSLFLVLGICSGASLFSRLSIERKNIQLASATVSLLTLRGDNGRHPDWGRIITDLDPRRCRGLLFVAACVIEHAKRCEQRRPHLGNCKFSQQAVRRQLPQWRPLPRTSSTRGQCLQGAARPLSSMRLGEIASKHRLQHLVREVQEAQQNYPSNHAPHTCCVLCGIELIAKAEGRSYGPGDKYKHDCDFERRSVRLTSFRRRHAWR